MGDEHSVLQTILSDPNAEPIPLPLSLLKQITNNFSVSNEIGRGGFGVVYKGVLSNGTVVAVKELCDAQAMVEEKSFEGEVTCLIRVRHRNIVRLLGYCSDTQVIFTEHQGKKVPAKVRARLLCFEYVSNGDLDPYTKTDASGGLDWQQRYILMKGICHGLRYIHKEEGIIHLDMKPQNILLDHEMTPKIADFGLSRIFGTQTRRITANIVGSIGYMAPEYIHGGLITPKADIYSLGVILLRVITGPRSGPTMTENVVEQWRKRLQVTLSYSSVEALCEQVERCVKLALKCVQTDPTKRPNIVEIVDLLDERKTVTSTKLLVIHPMELRFPFNPNKLVTCPLYLTNCTDHRVAFRIQPGRPERYFAEWLCGVVPPRSTYTLIVTMRGLQQSVLGTDQFLIQQGSVMGEYQLKSINQGKADTEYGVFFEEVVDKGMLTLTAVCDPQQETTTEIISTENFEKMVSMDVHPTEPWIITSHSNGHICLWDYQTGKMVNSFEVTRNKEVLTAKFIARKQWIVAGGDEKDGCINVYSYNTMERIKSFRAFNNQVTSLAIHPTKPYVLSASYDLEIKLWDWGNGWKCAQIFEEHSSSVMQIAFNPKDINSFASVSKDKNIKIWNVYSPHSNGTLTGHSSNVRCLDYFTGGDKQYIITGSDDGTAKIWDLQKMNCVKTLEGHANRVSTVCSHPKLQILITGSRDGTVRLWNSNTFGLERILNFSLRKVHALGCREDLTSVVIGHSHGLAIWEIGHEDNVTSRSENAVC